MNGELRYRPYKDEARDFVYNLLFCDDRALFAPKDGKKAKGALATILSEKPTALELRTIAQDALQEGRLRALAFNRLREMRVLVPARILLGTIVEVALTEGLDTLAVYSDGSVRYINHAGGVSIFEGKGARPVAEKVDAMLEASDKIIENIGPWDKPRRPPPAGNMMRLTFLVSDGLYFGEGPFGTLAKDPMSAPLVKAATELLVAVADMKDGQRAR